MREFFRKERVAGGLRLDALYHFWGKMSHQSANLVIREGLHVKGLHGMFALHMSQERAQGMFGGQFVFAACQQQYNRMTQQATRKITQQLTTARVCPLHIIQYYHQWCPHANCCQQLKHSLPQVGARFIAPHLVSRITTSCFPTLPIPLHQFTHFRQQRLEWFKYMRMLSQVLLLPEM